MNNEAIAKEYLLKGLSKQNTKFELCLVDNRASTYKSASEAINRAGNKANGDYLMFVHQDVLLASKSWLKETENLLTSLTRMGLAGVAGMLKPKFVSELDVSMRYWLLQKIGNLSLWWRHYGRGNVLHGANRLPWAGCFISDVTPVQTVDELLLIIPRSVWELTKFDENTCVGWHLYGVDFALTAARKGFKVYALPCPSVWHRSTGLVDYSYIRTLAKISRKHKRERAINTTLGLVPTTKLLLKLLWQPRSPVDLTKALA